jgi:endo-1,4-beta-xylanase
MGGMPGTGGKSGSGGGPGTGGTPGTGGKSGLGGGPGTGGTPGTGGKSGLGGGPGTGGTPGTGGKSGLGGGPGTGGMPGTGGKSGSGGASGTGGGIGTGGVANTGGTIGTGGSTGSGGSASGGTTTTGGMTGSGGITGSGGATAHGGSTGSLPRFFGNLDTNGSIRSDFATYWDQFSPENAGRWGAVQASSSSSFGWASLDASYKYCKDNNIVFKERSFIGGTGQPAWTSSLTTSTGPVAVQSWMKTFCDRFPRTALIDVVNEPPPHTTPGYADVIGGSGSSGYDWIVNSFKWAHDACPNAILILNDYNNLETDSVVQHTIDIVNAIVAAGAPIHAVGCETHDAAALPSSTLKANIDKIATLTGLPIYITEYDLSIADDDQQRAVMQDHVTMFWNNANVKGITYFGYIVGATWRMNTGLMQSSGTMRPAMIWLMDFFGR